MNESNQQHANEKQLWRQFAAQDQTQPVLSDLEPNLLAAYIDGKAEASQVEQIESLMASNPVLLEELIELRQLQDAGATLVCQAFLDRAKALLPGSPIIPSRTAFWQRLQWAAAAAAVFLACLGGYTDGQTTFQDQLVAEASLSSQAPMELDELTLALILLPNGSNGGEK
jgi:anti-sigma factor RsiW